MRGRVRPVLSALALTAAAAATAGGINGINGGMPNRISMNVTVPKQTQGATFGEKVNAGLHAAGSAVASGASLIIECGAAACAVALPDGSGFLADLQSLRLGPLEPAQGVALRKGPAGASLLGGAVPGGSIVSAAVSSVGSLAGGSGGGAAAASYAATGRAASPPALTTRVREDGAIDVVEPLAEGDYALNLEVTRAAGAPGRSAKPAAPARIRMRLVFSAADDTLRARPDSPANAISATQ
jgi:hypothetical protein